MNWDALGAIAELLGAIAVLATLVYLTLQVRQNTNALNSSNNHRVMDAFNALNVTIAGDADVARIFYTGIAAPETLTEAEQNRFQHLMHTVANVYRNLFHQYLDGTFPEARWRIWAREARQLLVELPGGAFFRSRTATYEDLFAYLETLPGDDAPLTLPLGGAGDASGS